MKKTIEIISLIYKSPAYLKFIVGEMLSPFNKVDGWDVTVRIIANDANQAVLDALPTCGIPYTVYNDKDPNRFYLNRVYAAYNHAIETSSASLVACLNSDIMVSQGWLQALIDKYTDKTIPCSWMVESGRMPSMRPLVSRNFGQTLKTLDREGFLKFADQIRCDEVVEKGAYMPCLMNRDLFLRAEKFPEGNIYNTFVGDFHGGQYLKSGDAYFFEDVLEKKFGIKHITVKKSLCFHLQSGEMYDNE